MAIRKASDSNLTGKKYNDASAAATKIADIPDKPVSITMTSESGTIPTATVVAAATGGTTTTVKITASPGGANVTGTSPVNLTSLVNNGIDELSTYTFTATPKNVDGLEGPASNASASYTVPQPIYELLNTYNSSTTFTVPTGKVKLAVVVVNGGTAGNAGSGSGGGKGGAGGAIYGFKDQSVTAGDSFSVTIGGAGGATSFGSLLTSGNGTGNASTKIAGNAAGTGGNGGVGRTPGWASGFNGVPGQAGNAGGTVVFTGINQIGTIQFGGGGGGGGDYATQNFTLGNSGGGGGAGGAGGGGNGGGGGGTNTCYYNCSTRNGGGSGQAGTSGGGGGGGGGHTVGGGGAGAGGSGRVLVYGK
jgi:hypothetical protein